MHALIHDAFVAVLAITQIGAFGLSVEGIHNELTRNPNARKDTSHE